MGLELAGGKWREVRWWHAYRVLRMRWQRIAVFAALGIPLVFFVLVPLLLLILNSFREIGLGDIEFAFTKLTLGNYLTAYANPKTWKMLWDSFVFALGSTAVAFVLGGLMAFLIERTDAPYRRFAYVLMLVPLMVPGMLEAIAWVLLLSPTIGLVNKVWMSIGFDAPLLSAYGMPVMWWVQGISMSPLTFLLLGAVFRRMDPAMEEAAIACGAPIRKVITQVTGKLILPAIMGVVLLNFVRALEALEVPLILGLRSNIVVFSTGILSSVRFFPPEYGLGFAYSIILIAFTVLGLFAYSRAVGRAGKYTVVTGKGYRPRIINLGKWKVFAVGFQVFFAIFAVGLPYFVLLWASLLPSYQVPSIEMLSQVSLHNYTAAFDRPDILPMLQNTAIVAVVTSVGVMSVSLMVSWVVFRIKIKGVAVLDGLAFLPYALPSIAMGIAFMVLFLSFKNPVYGTIWILVIAYIVRDLPYGTRFTHAGLLQVHKELEEAAKVSGASFRTMFLRVVVPIMRPALVGCGLYVFIMSVKVFSIAAILSSPSSMVLSVQIWQLWNEGLLGNLAALAIMMIAGLGILTLLSGRTRLGQIGG